MTAKKAHHKRTEGEHLRVRGKPIRGGNVASRGETEIKRRGKRRSTGVAGNLGGEKQEALCYKAMVEATVIKPWLKLYM
jgi:hypothetical protein